MGTEIRKSLVLFTIVLMGTMSLMPVMGSSPAGETRGPGPMADATPWTDPLDDLSNVYVPSAGLVGVEVSGGTAHLKTGLDSGWLASEIITCPPAYRYDLVVLEVDTPGDSKVLLSILNASADPSEVGFANETIGTFKRMDVTDLPMSSIGPSRYPAIRIQVSLVASGADRPSLLSWTLYYIDQEEWRDDFLSTAKMQDPRGLNVTDGEVSLNLSRKSLTGVAEYDPFPPILLANDWYMSAGGLDAFFANAQGTGYNDKVTIPGRGVHGVGVDDLNGDGYLDLVCANYGTSSGSDSQIYWGSSSGTWSDTGAKTLSTRWGRNAVSGDFNGAASKPGSSTPTPPVTGRQRSSGSG